MKGISNSVKDILSLLQEGVPLSAKEIASRSGTDYRKVYDILNVLKITPLVTFEDEIEAETTKKKYNGLFSFMGGEKIDGSVLPSEMPLELSRELQKVSFLSEFLEFLEPISDPEQESLKIMRKFSEMESRY